MGIPEAESEAVLNQVATGALLPNHDVLLSTVDRDGIFRDFFNSRASKVARVAPKE